MGREKRRDSEGTTQRDGLLEEGIYQPSEMICKFFLSIWVYTTSLRHSGGILKGFFFFLKNEKYNKLSKKQTKFI